VIGRADCGCRVTGGTAGDGAGATNQFTHASQLTKTWLTKDNRLWQQQQSTESGKYDELRLFALIQSLSRRKILSYIQTMKFTEFIEDKFSNFAPVLGLQNTWEREHSRLTDP